MGWFKQRHMKDIVHSQAWWQLKLMYDIRLLANPLLLFNGVSEAWQQLSDKIAFWNAHVLGAQQKFLALFEILRLVLRSACWGMHPWESPRTQTVIITCSAGFKHIDSHCLLVLFITRNSAASLRILWLGGGYNCHLSQKDVNDSNEPSPRFFLFLLFLFAPAAYIQITKCLRKKLSYAFSLLFVVLKSCFSVVELNQDCFLIMRCQDVLLNEEEYEYMFLVLTC